MDAIKQAILRRRMAFVGSALAAVTGCDKPTPPQPVPTPVVVGEGGAPATPKTVAPTPAPPQPKLSARPATTIPETDCQPDKDALLAKKAFFDEIHDELEKIHATLPIACDITTESCKESSRPIAKQLADVRDRIDSARGLCGCAAPIVATYVSEQQGAARARQQELLAMALSKPGEPEEKALQVVIMEEATPRPCLSCIQCEPKSGCD